MYIKLRFDKATYLSILYKLILHERFSNSLWGADVLLFSGFINIVSILFYNFFDFVIVLYTFLVNSFALYEQYVICLILLGKFSNVLPAFTCASTITSQVLLHASPFVASIENISLLKALRVNSRPS